MRTLLLILILNLSSVAFAQDSQPREKGEEWINRHTVTLSYGRATRLDEHDNYIPRAIGADYLYRLTPRWEIGSQFDLDFDDRNYQPDLFLAVAITSFSITDRWPVFAGVGLETHVQQSTGVEALFRLGTEYTFFLGKKHRFALLPGAFADIHAGKVSPSFVLAFGYFFGTYQPKPK